jgi:phosphate:Na+ symporter
VPSFSLLLSAAEAHPLVDVILAAILTWAAHSSVAVVLLVMSFAARGMVTPEAAFALVLGANLGSAVNPCIEGAAGDDPAAKRLPIGNLVNRVVGVAVALAVLGPASRLIGMVEATPARAVADFHTAFNLVVALVFFPLLPAYAQVLRRFLPSRVNEADPSRPLYLDRAAQENPVVALGAAAREALRLADLLEAMLQGFRDALARDDRRRTSEARRLADVMERLNDAIKTYLSGLDPDGLTEGDHRRVAEVLAFSTNLEHAGDVVDKGLLGSIARKIKRGLAFSKEGESELLGMTDRLIANLRVAASLFVTEDVRAARMLAAEKEAFRDMEGAATNAHFERLRAGRLESTETSALHLDVLRDLARVNAHLVAAVAYPVLERQGELLPSRLRQEGE